MSLRWLLVAGLLALVSLPASRAFAEPPKTEVPAVNPIEELKDDLAAAKKALADQKAAADNAATLAKERGDTAWMLISSALVLMMVPGLALFYCGMVRRKNVLATMMQSM